METRISPSRSSSRYLAVLRSLSDSPYRSLTGGKRDALDCCFAHPDGLRCSPADERVRSIVAAPYERKYLPSFAFKSLAALAEVVVGSEDVEIAPEKVAENVDRYMDAFTARRRWIVPVALCVLWIYPIRFLRPPFPWMAKPQRRAFVERHFLLDISRRRIHFLRRAIQAMVRLSQQMVFLGYYGDPSTFDSVGYRPFSKRVRYPDVVPAKVIERPGLATMKPEEIPGDTLDADVVVVGSGAGGSIVSYRMAEAGHRVLVLEGGRHVEPSEFSEDEIRQLT
jgi:hypothetical protein